MLLFKIYQEFCFNYVNIISQYCGFDRIDKMLRDNLWLPPTSKALQSDIKYYYLAMLILFFARKTAE